MSTPIPSLSKRSAYSIALRRIEVCRKTGNKSLNLSSLGLNALPPEVADLHHLAELDLSYNVLTDIPYEIHFLKNLMVLDLSHNDFQDFPLEICSLINLKKLVLEGNSIGYVAAQIEEMVSLSFLDLNDCDLGTLPAEFSNLAELKSLFLSGNKFLQFPKEVCHLKGLETISISQNLISSIPKEIGLMRKLRYCDIGENFLFSLPEEFGRLSSLAELSLHGNTFEVFPVEVCFLSCLESLYFGSNSFSEFPVEIGNLHSLKKLYAFNNSIKDLGDCLFDIETIEVLNFSYNKIEILSEKISNLINLKELYLDNNQLLGLPENLGYLESLEILKLSNNKLRDMGRAVVNLSSLTIFDLSNNRIENLPVDVEKIESLSELYLHSNNLVNLPSGLRRLNNLRCLSLHGNPQLNISPSVLGKHPSRTDKDGLASAKSILDYYFELMQGDSRPLNEVKLILVGRGGAGKTSTVQALQDIDFNENEESTPGIALSDWEMSKCRGGAITAHIWDFAGQVITHSLHQFFFSVRSIYVVVLTGRENCERDDAEYWLRLIKAFGTDDMGVSPPVIVALNKWDTPGCRPSIDREALQERYPFIQGFVEIDCKTTKGVEKLKVALCRTVEKLPWVREPFPITWSNVRRELSKRRGGKKRAHLTYGEYREICERYGVTDFGEQDSLAEILHNLGAALNYRNDPRLREATVLQPEWLTKNVYSLIRRAEKKFGVLIQSDIDIVLRSEKDLEMRRYLLQIMERFEIAYGIRASDHISERWLVPQALPDQQPKEASGFVAAEDATRLRYSYAALPEGLVARAVVRLHDLIDKAGDTLLQWASGVILTRDGARALLRAEPQDRQVAVIVTGPIKARQQLAGLCRLEMREIHSEIRGLDPLEETMYLGEWIPVTALEEDERQGRQTGVATRSKGTISIDPVEVNNAYSERAARNELLWKPTVFISYSKNNLRQRQQLEIQLKILKNEGLLNGVWHDRMIDPGDYWDGKIQHEINTADIFLFLASASALATDYITQHELPRALELQANEKVVFIPIVTESCRWHTWNKGAMGQLNALPEKAKPLNKWRNQADAWSSVADGLVIVCKKLIEAKRKV